MKPLLSFLVSIVLLIRCAHAEYAEIEITPNPASDHVTYYTVYRVISNGWQVMGVIPADETILGMDGVDYGQEFFITATNVDSKGIEHESVHSDSETFEQDPPSKPGPFKLRRVEKTKETTIKETTVTTELTR